MSEPLVVESTNRARARPAERRRPVAELARDRRVLYPSLAVVTLGLWHLVAATTLPIIFPSPGEVTTAMVQALGNGTLAENILVSYFRILAGWAIGCMLAVPLGLVAGRIALVRAVVEPYIDFFRFIPPIAFITLFLIWFGLGETSKVLLIVYTTLFVMFLNTMAGAMSVEREKVRAAQCLGASDRQIFRHVVVPATVPYIITGMRLAMGNSFMTVVAAEFVAAQSGIGYMIFSSRLFAQTNYVFVGIITLGLMGFFANWVLCKAVARLAYRYDVRL